MAAKKKSAPQKSAPNAKPASKKAQGKPVEAAKPAKLGKTSKQEAAKSKSVKAAAKPAKKLAAKPSKAVAVKSTKPAGSAKPASSAKPEKSSLVSSVKRAAAKVVQVAAKTAMKILDADLNRAAPAFELQDEKGEAVSSASLAGKPYLIYFYPKDDTPGCTKEACDIRDNFGRFGQRGIRVLGVSPDSTKSHAKFGQKYGLPFTLLSDPDKTLAKAYGVWGEKNNYGKKYMGIIRSTFLVGPDGLIKKAYRGVKVDGHVSAILEDAASLL